MAESHVITGLKAKRADLARQLDAMARERNRLQANLRHVDAALKIMGFEGDPAALQGKRRYNALFLRGVTYAQLAEKLGEIGVQESEQNLNKKISRGGFSAAFLLQCLRAIGVQSLYMP